MPDGKIPPITGNLALSRSSASGRYHCGSGPPRWPLRILHFALCTLHFVICNLQFVICNSLPPLCTFPIPHSPMTKDKRQVTNSCPPAAAKIPTILSQANNEKLDVSRHTHAPGTDKTPEFRPANRKSGQNPKVHAASSRVTPSISHSPSRTTAHCSNKYTENPR